MTWSTNLFYVNCGTNGLTVAIANGVSTWAWVPTVPAPTLNQWHHIAITRQGTTWKLFVDGQIKAMTSGVTANIIAQGSSMLIGAATGNPGGTAPFNGYISNFRLINGRSLYTYNFTPPLGTLTAVANTAVLLSETTSANVLTDASTNNFTIQANSASASFNGTSANLSATYTTTNHDWYTASNYYTLEAWINPTTFTGWASNGQPTLIGNMDWNTTNNFWSFGINGTGNVAFSYAASSGNNIITSNTTVTANTWNHIAMTYNSVNNNIILYVNGTKDTLANLRANVGTFQSNASSRLTIGAYNNTYIAGNVSGIRMVKSATTLSANTVYTGTFTPPTQPALPVYNSTATVTSLLLQLNGTVTDTGGYGTTITNSGVTYSYSNSPFTVTYSNVTPFTTPTIPSQVTGNVLINLDMANYTSGNAWVDSANGYGFTFYANSGTTYPGAPPVTNVGTSKAYFSTNNTWWAKSNTSSILPGSSTNYTKGIVIRGTNTFAAPFGSGYALCSSEAYDTFLYNKGAGNHMTGSSSYSDVVQTLGNVSSNQWYYMSVSCDFATGWTFYANGQLVGVAAPTAVKPASTPVVGATQTVPGVVGNIAAAHIYTRTLTAAEHLQNAQYWLSRYNGTNPA